jgi:small subunit ribosomal protein S4e|tara:strand:- start:527 stop:1243 length:717 start_codon:yes stop_codon:yes gene_type:complete
MKRHLKRLAAPRSWSIPRKDKTWVVKTSPGPHNIQGSVPLLIVVRDILKYGLNGRESKRIINEGQILIDKKPRKDYKFPVGLGDIIEIPVLKEKKIVLYNERGKIILKNILIKDAKGKLCKILNKSLVKGGKIQLHFHDGRNILLNQKDDVYNVKDSVILDILKNNIIEHHKFKEGNKALIIGGKHSSKIAKIKEINVNRSPGANTVVMEDKDGEFQTVEDYIFIVGEKQLKMMDVNK